jgi:hypothetical protein
MKTLIVSLALAVISFNAFADGLFRADFGYVMDETNNGSDTKNSRQLIDVYGAYVFDQGWLILGEYAMEKDDSTSGGSTTEGNRTSFGPGFGWMSRDPVGMYATATYFFSSKYNVNGSSYDGWGYQIELGLKVDLSKVFLTTGLAYEAFDYSKNNGNSLSPDYKQNHIAPHVGLQIEF